MSDRTSYTHDLATVDPSSTLRGPGLPLSNLRAHLLSKSGSLVQHHLKRHLGLGILEDGLAGLVEADEDTGGR